MQKRMTLRVTLVAAGLFAVAVALEPVRILAAGDCVDQPDQAAGHWRYRIDRASGRKCWHLTEAEPAARQPQAETPPQPAPEPLRQPSLTSFFSSLGFTTASVGAPQPDAPARDARGPAIAQPEGAKGDDAAAKRRQRADAKPAPVPKPERQASSRPGKEALDQAERDRLFQQYLQWKERQ